MSNEIERKSSIEPLSAEGREICDLMQKYLDILRGYGKEIKAPYGYGEDDQLAKVIEELQERLEVGLFPHEIGGDELQAPRPETVPAQEALASQEQLKALFARLVMLGEQGWRVIKLRGPETRRINLDNLPDRQLHTETVASFEPSLVTSTSIALDLLPFTSRGAEPFFDGLHPLAKAVSANIRFVELPGDKEEEIEKKINFYGVVTFFVKKGPQGETKLYPSEDLRKASNRRLEDLSVFKFGYNLTVVQAEALLSHLPEK